MQLVWVHKPSEQLLANLKFTNLVFHPVEQTALAAASFPEQADADIELSRSRTGEEG